MATFAEIKLRARQRADMVNSTFVTDGELGNFVNASACELYDILIDSRGENYYVLSSSFSAVAGQKDYPLPTDFLKLLAVDLVSGENQIINVRAFQWQERNLSTTLAYSGDDANIRYQLRGSNITLTPTPNGGAEFRLWYVPRCPALVADGDSFDGINGWEEYIVIDAAIKMRIKEESPVQELMIEKQAIKTRIESASKARDSAEPAKVQDTSSTRGGYWWK